MLLNRDLKDIEKRKYFSPQLLGIYRGIKDYLIRYARLRVLDVGCGDMPYYKIVSTIDGVSEYHGLDVERRTDKVIYIGDVQDMSMIEDSSYDTLLCLQVLEHIRNPRRALLEMYRVFKPGGHLIISVPHLTRLHEVPNDYFRFTKYGLKVILNDAGFIVTELRDVGGIMSFLGHQISSIFLLLFWNIPFIRIFIYWVNKWFIVIPCYSIDKLIDKDKLFALGYACVCVKKNLHK